MDKDKRELAWKKWKPEFDVSANQAAAKCGFYAGYDAAAGQQQWVAIETVDDLPKVGGRYLWQFRNVDYGIEFDLRIFKPSMDGQHFVKAFVAWKRPAPYQRPSAVEGDENDD